LSFAAAGEFGKHKTAENTRDQRQFTKEQVSLIEFGFRARLYLTLRG